MGKWLVAGSITAVIIIGIIVYLFTLRGTSKNPQSLSTIPTDDRILTLQQEVNTLLNQVNAISSPSSSLNNAVLSNPNNTTDQKLAVLQSSINELNTRVTKLEQGSSPVIATSSSPQNTVTSATPVYIPLGSTDPNSNENWQSIDSMAVMLNPADYPGYTSMQLEVGLRLNAGTGVANVRLLDSTDQTAVTLSQVSTSSTSFGVLSSSKFTLSTGPKLYTVQVMSSLGDIMFIQNARLKVNF